MIRGSAARRTLATAVWGSEFSPLKVSFIGAGKMAEAIATGLKAQGDVHLNVFDINKSRLALFQKEFDATIFKKASESVVGADLVVIACKPQNIETVGKALCGSIGDKTIVVSILAGTTLEKLGESLGTNKLVRTMPNTPATVLEGTTVWCCGDGISARDKDLVSKGLSAFGLEVEVLEEKYLDMATAISGSGPAYVLLLMESMIETGVHMGFPRETAAKLVQQTVRGTAIYAMKSDANSASMRADITSPGGTTASGLYSLERGGFRTVVADGLWASYRRSLELGGNDSNVGPGRVVKR